MCTSKTKKNILSCMKVKFASILYSLFLSSIILSDFERKKCIRQNNAQINTRARFFLYKTSSFIWYYTIFYLIVYRWKEWFLSLSTQILSSISVSQNQSWKYLRQILPHRKQITPHLSEIVEILPMFHPYLPQLIPNLEKFLPFLPKLLPHAKILLPLAKLQYRKIQPMLSKIKLVFWL